MTYAAFIAALYNTIGIEFGAHLVQTVVEILDKSRQDWLKAAKNEVAQGAGAEAHKEQEKEMGNKKCVNFVTLLGYLYDFEVVACVIIYDITRLAISEMSELDVELLLRVIRISGFQLRSDDPSSLKEIVLMVQEGISKRDQTTVSTRAKFMVETIMDWKNNKRKAQKKNAQNDLQMERLKKFVGNLGKKRGGVSNEALRVSLNDIRSIHTKGKWWLVGAAWAGRSSADEDNSFSREGQEDSAVKETMGTASSDLLKLARAMKMNTDVRRSIFVVLMSSEDCADAMERLLKLRLKDKQEREIVRVLLHCCAQVGVSLLLPLLFH